MGLSALLCCGCNQCAELCLFVLPVCTFSVYDIRYIWSFIIFFIVAFLIGGRTDWLKEETHSARQRKKSVRALALYAFSRQIAAVSNLDYIARKLANHSGETIGRKTVVLLPENQNKLSLKCFYSC